MEEAREPMGAHKKVHIRRISENPEVAERWEKAHGRLPTEEDVVAMFEESFPCSWTASPTMPSSYQAPSTSCQKHAIGV